MPSRSEVIYRMQCGGLSLPPDHPICDGKQHRIGKGKKAWYKINEVVSKITGEKVYYGVFGIWHGDDNGAIGIPLDAGEVTGEEMEAVKARQAEAAAAEAAKREEAAGRAANRARGQWLAAGAADPEGLLQSAYLDRKQVTKEGVRVDANGTLLIPVKKYSVEGGQLVGLQKIAPRGSKKFNADMAKAGAACLLGGVPPGPDVLLVGLCEGYATGRSVRMAYDIPLFVAFDAGNLLAVAQMVRQLYPNAHILFFADDDWQLRKRLAKRLVKEFRIAATIDIDGAPQPLTEFDFDAEDRDEALLKRLAAAVAARASIALDGEEHLLRAEDNEIVRVTASVCMDANDVSYINADIRNKRVIRTIKFENAGISKAKAAAKEVGNASVCFPEFSNRGDNKWTDFNDLHVQQSLQDVLEQIRPHIEAVLVLSSSASQTSTHDLASVVDSPADSAGAAFSPDVESSTSPLDPAAAPLPSASTDAADSDLSSLHSSAAPADGADPAVPSLPPPPLVDAELPAEAAPPVDGAQAEGDSVDPAAVPPPPLDADANSDTMTLVFTLEWALRHCALVQGTTEVWDSMNKLRMKRAAFVTMMGKDKAKEWEAHKDRRTVSPRSLPKTVRGVAATATGGAGDDGIVMMLDRYTLLYGTKTVWDADKKKVISYDAMVLARGSMLADRWLAHPLRLEKDLDKLVFDPTERVDLNTHINMFEGFPLKPKKDEAKANLVLDLLWNMCSSEPNGEDVFNWVLRWLAYPLQHPGAKMQTALLFFGRKQGTGKSLFFEGIMKPMYGVHGATGGQHQLEGTYTMWRSQKLFVLFEEILSRQDKYSYFGLVKHLITGRDTPITQKFKDDRVEANHLNVVLLSNEFQAVPLEPDDRRFEVVDVQTNLDPELLRQLTDGEKVREGIVEAFYAFLLDYPLGDFGPHTKPVMTPSKQRIIEFGRPDWETFYLAWSTDMLSVPYCSCLSDDLYQVFQRYSNKYGLRAMSHPKFSVLIAQELEKDRQWVTLGAKKQLLTVFHVPQKDGEEPETLQRQVERFRNAADLKGSE